MRKMVRYKVVPKLAEENGYTAFVPSLPGCVSEDDTCEEPLDNTERLPKNGSRWLRSPATESLQATCSWAP